MTAKEQPFVVVCLALVIAIVALVCGERPTALAIRYFAAGSLFMILLVIALVGTTAKEKAP